MLILKIIVITLDIVFMYSMVKICKLYYYKRKYNEEQTRYEYFWDHLRSDAMLDLYSKDVGLYKSVLNIQINMSVDTSSYKKAYLSFKTHNDMVYDMIKDYLPGEKQKNRNNTILEILK